MLNGCDGTVCFRRQCHQGAVAVVRVRTVAQAVRPRTGVDRAPIQVQLAGSPGEVNALSDDAIDLPGHIGFGREDERPVSEPAHRVRGDAVEELARLVGGKDRGLAGVDHVLGPAGRRRRV